jgi:hypothetical protein
LDKETMLFFETGPNQLIPESHRRGRNIGPPIATGPEVRSLQRAGGNKSEIQEVKLFLKLLKLRDSL